MKTVNRGRASLLLAVIALAVPASAEAQVTLGQLPAGIPEALCTRGPTDLWQVKAASGNGYTAPRAGILTSWRTTAAETGEQSLELKVFRPSSPTSAVVVAHDGPRQLTPNTVNTFSVGIPVQAGDIIGLNDLDADLDSPNACQFFTDDFGDGLIGIDGNVGDGETVSASTGFGNRFRLNVAATLLLPPTISAITPASGPFVGGTRVTISGSEFARVIGVSFGATPATSFSVDSESQITAVVPAGAPATAVPVTVATAAGSVTSPTAFGFDACRVPKLKGKTLKAARKLMRGSGCRLGRVKRRYGVTVKVSKVVGQSPKPGALLPPGAKVRLSVVDRPADV